MSAFLCSDLHTVTVALAMVQRDIGPADVIACAMGLRDANNKALQARYGADPEPLGRIGGLPVTHGAALQVNTLARCLAYQCSEGDVMETHPAAAWLYALIDTTGGRECELVAGLYAI